MFNIINLLAEDSKGHDALKSRDFQTAISSFSKCIEKDKNNPAWFIKRSNALCLNKEFEKALSDIYTALSLDQSNADAYATKGLIEWSMGNLQSALLDYNKAISLKPDSIAYMNRGQIKIDLGDQDGAIEDCKIALKLDPSNSLASQILMIYSAMSPEAYKMFLKKRAQNRTKD